jgi:hypothetical protein
MHRLPSLLLIASLAPIVLASPVWAQIAGLDEVAAEYDAALGTLPDAQGWTFNTDDPPPDDGLTTANYSVAGGILSQGPTGGGSSDDANRQWFETTAFGYDFDDDVVIVDLRLHILSSTILAPPTFAPRAGFGVLLADADGEQVILYVGTSQLFLFGSDTVSSPAVSFPASAGFADYRLRVDEYGASVRVDGTELAYLPRSDFSPSTGPRLLVGDLTISQRSSSEIQTLVLGRASPAETEVRELVWVTETVPLGGPDATSPKSNIVSCPPGTYVVGGGAAAQGGTYLRLNDSHPSGSPPYTQWFARAEQDLPEGGAWELRVDVLCGEIPGQEILAVTADNSGWGGSATASCGGKVAVGSGAQTSPQDDEKLGLRESAPVSPVGPDWRASAYDFSGGVVEGTNFDTTSYATCTHDREWHVETWTTLPNSNSTNSIAAPCPLGMVTVGGGARVVGADDSTSIVASYPRTSLGTDPEEWYATAVETVPTTDTWSVEAMAFCARRSEATVTRHALAGRWRADFGYAIDDLGANHGTLHNGASIETGLFDQAFSLERSNEEWLEIPGDDFYPEGSFTVDAWIQTDSLAPGEYATIASLYDPGGTDPTASWSTWNLDLTPDGYARGWVRPGAFNSISTVTGTQSLADGEPHHVALVRDIRLSVMKHLLYVDGVLVAEDPVIPPEDGPLYPLGEIDPVSVGVFRPTLTTDLTREWDGLIDDLKFYHRALSPDEIRNTAGCGVPVVPRVLNLDAGRFGATAGASDDHRLCVYLEAGTYTLELVTPGLDPEARFTAWSPSSADPWVTAYSAVGEIDAGVSGGSAAGESTAQDAFANTALKTETLILTADQRVYFSVDDAPPVDDNRGGVSVAIALPEPSATVGLIAGAGLLALLRRVRRHRIWERLGGGRAGRDSNPLGRFPPTHRSPTARVSPRFEAGCSPR